jgi:hypothetical protein
VRVALLLNLCIMVKTFDLEILKYEHENHKFYNFQSINMIIKGHNTGIIKLINNQHQNWLVYCGKQIQNIGWRETNVWAQKSQLFHFCLYLWFSCSYFNISRSNVLTIIHKLSSVFSQISSLLWKQEHLCPIWTHSSIY